MRRRGGRYDLTSTLARPTKYRTRLARAKFKTFGHKGIIKYSNMLLLGVGDYCTRAYCQALVHPEKVKTNPVQEFMVLQDNADKAQHKNMRLAARKNALEKTIKIGRP